METCGPSVLSFGPRRFDGLNVGFRRMTCQPHQRERRVVVACFRV